MQVWEDAWEWYPSHTDQTHFQIDVWSISGNGSFSQRPAPVSVNELVSAPFELTAQLQEDSPPPLSTPRKKGTSLLIPRIIHRIWVGPNPLPPDYQYYGETWKAHHPEWEHRLWTDSNLPPELYAFDALQNTTDVRSRADIIRYYLLFVYGGVYVDADFECLKSIEPLLVGLESFASKQDPSTLNIAILGSVPKQAFFHKTLYFLPQWMNLHEGRGAEHKTGPRFVTFLYSHFPAELSLLPTELFYPYHWGEVYRSEERSLQKFDSKWPDAYAVHHWGEIGFGRIYQRIMSGSSSHRWMSFYRAGRYHAVPSCCMKLTRDECVFTNIKANETARDVAQRMLGSNGLPLDAEERAYVESYSHTLLTFLDQQIVSFSHHRWQLKRLIESPRFADAFPSSRPLQLRVVGGERNDCHKLLNFASILSPAERDTIVTAHKMFTFSDRRDLQFYLGGPHTPTARVASIWINGDVLLPYQVGCTNTDELHKREEITTVCLVDAFQGLLAYMAPQGVVQVVLRDANVQYVPGIPEVGTPNEIMQACGTFCADVARALANAGFGSISYETKYRLILDADTNAPPSFAVSIGAVKTGASNRPMATPAVGLTGEQQQRSTPVHRPPTEPQPNVPPVPASSLKDVVVINLDRRRDRWDLFLGRVRALPVSLPDGLLDMFRRFSAVDGSMASRAAPRVANLLQHAADGGSTNDAGGTGSVGTGTGIFNIAKRQQDLQHELHTRQVARRLSRYAFVADHVLETDAGFCGRTFWRTGYAHFTNGGFMPNGVLGCFLSHLNLWFELATSPSPSLPSGEGNTAGAVGALDYMMVFEDDAELAPNFAARWAEAEAFLAEDLEWDIVFLGYGDDRDLYGDEMVFPGVYRFSGDPRSYGRGTHGYLYFVLNSFLLYCYFFLNSFFLLY
jgi:GR25 family glycosyltransferase involved in LPS biosynthesis